MKKLFLVISCLALVFSSCKYFKKGDAPKVDTPITKEKSEASLVAQPADFADLFFEVLTAVNEEDKSTLNKYIHPDKGYYFVLTGQGVYNEYIHYDAIDSLFEYSNLASEFEANPFKHFLDQVANLEEEEKMVVEKSLFGQETCDFEEIGAFLDTDDAETSILSETYRANTERDGGEINADILIQLRDAEREATKRVFVGDGEYASIFYFTNIDDKWFLAIADMRDCGS